MNAMRTLASFVLIASPFCAMPSAQEVSAPERTLQMYDIYDLVKAVIDPPVGREVEGGIIASGTLETSPKTGEPVPLAARSGVAPYPGAEERDRLILAETEQLTEAVRAFVDPPFTDEDALRGTRGVIVALTDPVRHAWIESFLANLRENRDALTVTLRLIEAPVGTFAPYGAAGTSSVFANLEALEILVRELRAAGIDTRRINHYDLPGHGPLTDTFALHPAYVTDWKAVMVQPGRKWVADPVIERIANGRRTTMRAFPLGEQLHGLSLEYMSTRVVRPVPTRTMSLEHIEGPLEIALPEVRKVELSTRMQIREGHSVLTWIPSSDGKSEIGVVISAGAEGGRLPGDPTPLPKRR